MHGEKTRPSPMAGTSTTEIQLVERPWEGWDELVSGLQGAGLFHRVAWLKLWHSAYGQEGIGLVARRDGVVVAAMPIVRKASRIFGRYWVSQPYFDAAGPVGDPAGHVALLERALDLARERGDEYVEVRSEAQREWPWSVRADKVHVLLDLPDNPDALMKGFKKKLRSQVRRAAKENPVAERGGPELAGEFHAVYSEKMRELGSPGHSVAVFKETASLLPDDCRILLVRLEQQCVAGAVLLADGERVIIPWAATLSAVNHLSINMFLYFEALSWAIERGAKSFDFGRCDADSSHLKFKLQWGGTAQPLHWYRATPSGAEPPAPAQASAKMQLASKIWRKLPLAMTKALGPRMIKNLS